MALDVAHPVPVRRKLGEHEGGFRKVGAHLGEDSGGSIQHQLIIETGHDQFGLPVLAEQCFAALDVTASLYQRTAGAGQPIRLPHVSRRYREQEPFRIPRNYYYREQDLPDSTKETVGVYLFLTLPCSHLDKPDTDLVRALGFESPEVRAPAR